MRHVSRKGKKRNIILLIIIIAVLSVLVLKHKWIISLFMPEEEHLELEDCEEKLVEWCSECFSTNNENIDFWENTGTQIGKTLAECSNVYFYTEWTSDQDCTGTALDHCLILLELSIE